MAVRISDPHDPVDVLVLGHIAETVPTILAFGIFEIKGLATNLAVEQFHSRQLAWVSGRKGLLSPSSQDENAIDGFSIRPMALSAAERTSR